MLQGYSKSKYFYSCLSAVKINDTLLLLSNELLYELIMLYDYKLAAKYPLKWVLMKFETDRRTSYSYLGLVKQKKYL